MAKKNKLDAQAPRVMTRGQLSRHQREQQQLRTLYLVLGGIGLLIVLVLGSALLNQYVLRPGTQLATVNGTKIDLATYQKQRRWDIFNQLRYLEYVAQSGQSSGTDQTAQIQQLQSELQNMDTVTTYDPTTLSTLTDNILLKQEAAKIGINASTDDLKAEALKQFEPVPTPIPGPSNTPAPTDTPGTPTITPTLTATGTPITATPTMTGTLPTSTRIPTFTPTASATPGPSHTPTSKPTQSLTPVPVPSAQATATTDFASFISQIANGAAPGSGVCDLGCPSLSESDYLNLIVAPDYLKKKVTDTLKANVPRTVEEVHAQHILVATEDEAKEIKKELDGGYDWATLAAEKSTDTGSKDNSGDLGWFAQTAEGGPMVQEFSDAAFKLTTPGQISEPSQSSVGWHIIKLIERGQQELDDTSYQRAVDAAYTKWFDEKKKAANITSVLPTPTATAGTSLELPTAPPVDDTGAPGAGTTEPTPAAPIPPTVDSTAATATP